MNREMLQYILDYIKYRLEIEIENVLLDSNDDPEYSAVYTSNLLKSYLQVSHQLGISDITETEDFFIKAGFSGNEYALFESKRIKESVYYLGSQF